MMATATVNPYQQAARMAKAERLAVQLHAAGVLASEVPAIESRFWPPLAQILGVHPPSEETIALVGGLMAEMEAAKARVDQMLASGADPFARFA